MNAYTMKHWLLTALALCWLLPAQAQDDGNEGIARMVKITPKPGHERTLVEAVTGYHEWIANFEGHHRYNWYEILSGPDTGKYMARTGEHDWADFDAKYDWQDQADETFMQNVWPHVEDIDVWYTKEMPEFSHWPDSLEGYTHYHVESWYVKNGQYGKFRRGLQQIVDALKAGGYPEHWAFFSVESGGHGGQIGLVSPNKGWAGFSAKEPSFLDIMTEAMGSPEAFDAFMTDWSSTFKVGHNMTVKHMPDASDYGD